MEILEFKKLDLSEYKSLGDFDIKRIALSRFILQYYVVKNIVFIIV